MKTRNEPAATGTGGRKDDAPRTFDRVIHEFGHAIDARYGLRPRVEQVYRNSAAEEFAMRIQSWFGAPTRTQTPAPQKLVSELFTSQVSFSCEGYRP